MYPGASMAELAVQVLCSDEEGWTRGSGLVVARGLVLTAAHCVAGGQLLVRFAGGEERDASLVFAGDVQTCDLALIEFEGRSPEPQWRFGEVDRTWSDWVRGCWSVGFPAYKGARSAHVGGEIATLENIGTELLTLRLQSSPRERLHGSEWSAMSGAVVVAGDDVIVGVVGEHHRPEGADALTVFPVTALDERDDVAEFWARIGRDRRDRVTLPEQVGRQQARRPYIATVEELAPELLVGREDDLAALAAFATGTDGYRRIVGGTCWGRPRCSRSSSAHARPRSTSLRTSCAPSSTMRTPVASCCG